MSHLNEYLAEKRAAVLARSAAVAAGTAQPAHLKAHVRAEGRSEAIVRRVRERTAAEGGQPDMMEAVYRHLMEECIAYEHREFARLREGGAQDDRS